jgi:MFS family permease
VAVPKTRTVLALAAMTAFLDLVGFSIIFPLFPQMLSHYLALEGPGSGIGRLVEALEGLAGQRQGAEFLVVVLFGGLLGSVYSLLQFLFAPVWGSLSDRFGRRRTLLVTLAGTVLGYVGWLYAGTFAALVLARLLGGMMAGNLATVSAVIADVTSSKDRSKGMGILGASIGLGFIVGPAIGGLSSLWMLAPMAEAPPAGGAPIFGINPFSSAALAALVLSVVNFGAALVYFPETLPAERRGAAATTNRSANPVVLFRRLEVPGLRRVNLLSFLYLIAFSAMEFSLTFLTVERFAYSPRQNAAMFVFVGLVIALVQGGLIRRLAPRFGDRRVAQIGLLLLLPGFVCVGLAASERVLYGGLALMAGGSALANPCLSALVSRYAPSDQQGLALGVFRSLGALSRAVGPLAGGVLYWLLGGASPYLAGALLLAVPVAISFGLPPPPLVEVTE